MKRTGRRAALVGILGAAAVACAPRGAAREAPREALADGLYAILAEGDAPLAASPSARALRYDPRDADAESTEPARVLVIDASDFVPMVLAAAPASVRQADGRLLLEVSLASDQARHLEDFTRRHLGGKGALVLDGAPISVHKLRSVIEGGRVQITRCTDRACERILSKLTRPDAG